MMTQFAEKDSERRQFMRVFITITVIALLQATWNFYYSDLQKDLDAFIRYLFENFTNLVWDIPVILIMTYYHHISFRESISEAQTQSLIYANNQTLTFDNSQLAEDRDQAE